MKQIFSRLLVLLTLIISYGFLFASPVVASETRVLKLSKYLSDRHSPLAPFSEDFVKAADIYHYDYRLLVAISGVESGFGREFIRPTFNPYGWGGGLIYFESWQDGINKVSTGLYQGYLSKGATEVFQIGRIYCPPNSVNWANQVTNFMRQIEAVEIHGVAVTASPAADQLTLTI